MGYITIESENPEISWVLGKNPDSEMLCRSLRSGVLYGWYYNISTYVIRFVDYTDEVSFKKNFHDQYNYLGSLQYCSPLLLSACLIELFGSTLNKENPKDICCKNKLAINLIKLNTRAINFIKKLNGHIKQFTINISDTKYTGLFRLEIETNLRVKELLNYSYLLGNLLNVLVIGYVDKPRIEQLEKMIGFMIKNDVPYYPRYLIKTQMMSSNEFEKLKDKLETFNQYKSTMFWGNSQIQRYNFIESHISFNTDMIDFGCGEGFYVKKLLPKLSKSCKYIAWDADPEELAKVRYFKQSLDAEQDNLLVPETKEEFEELIVNLKSRPIVLMSEVFEHVGKDEIIGLVERIKNMVSFQLMVITTPDVGFNIHYSPNGDIGNGDIGNGDIRMRHPDHKYEYTKEEFEQIIGHIFNEPEYNKKFYQVGDIVGSNSITQSCIIMS
jgi:hypothetical protein